MRVCTAGPPMREQDTSGRSVAPLHEGMMREEAQPGGGIAPSSSWVQGHSRTQRLYNAPDVQ